MSVDRPPPKPSQSNDQETQPTTCIDDTLVEEKSTPSKPTTWQKFYELASYTPRRCRYDPENPPKFSLALNLLFGFAATFTVANLYYTHPILNRLATDFHVSYEKVSNIPTAAQAGYAAGLLLLCPMGDLLKRRPFVLWLVFFTATVWIGLCITQSFPVFCALSFITSVSTVTPQLMLPLVGDLAPPKSRATALSIVVSGLLFGMLIARVLSGVVAQFIGWRWIYWIALILQYLICFLLWLYMPDYPSTNPGKLTVPTYLRLLLDIGKMITKYPVLVQACLVGFFTSSIFTSFWTTLTFLLSGTPYHYDTVVIGLFALIGMGAMTMGPVYARFIIDRHVPLFSIILGECICLVGVTVGTYVGRRSVAGPVIQAVCIDLGLQTSQIANRSAIYRVAPRGRNRVNTAYMVSVFCGQLMGTAVGNRLYARGGWITSGSASVGFVGAALCVCFARGPHEQKWLGWRGGWNVKRDLDKETVDDKAVEDAMEEKMNGGAGGDVERAGGGGGDASAEIREGKSIEAQGIEQRV